jgi:hypothetical protein
MQNFKEYLRENEEHSLVFEVELNYSTSDMKFNLGSIHRSSEIRMFLDDFGALIKEDYPQSKTNFFPSEGNLYSTIPITKNETLQFFEDFKFTVLSKAHSFIDEKTIFLTDHTILVEREIPEWCKLTYPSFVFTAENSPITDFHNVHKHIQATSSITIVKAERIKSSVLGFMLMPELETIYRSNICEWVKIINRHLKGERDILDCQEEFITKGLKEYAKL